MTARLDREDATVTSWLTAARASGRRITLDASAFFPGGGGQPADTGRVRSGDIDAAVTSVTEEGPDIVLTTEPPLPDGFHALECVLDADRRRLLMRTHTAFHILAAVLGEGGAEVTGCNSRKAPGVGGSRSPRRL